MAVYKVIQDIEAEDKLVGPLTLKQFIYAAIAGVLVFIDFRIVIAANLGLLRWALIFLFSLPLVLFVVLAAPLGRDQPTELWLLSHIKFLLRPRKRLWNQAGAIATIQITAPKRVEQNLTNNLTQGEVSSRLKALATMLDSRGWAIQSTPLYKPATGVVDDQDRLVSSDTLPQQAAPEVDVRAGDDLLDEQSNATAQRYGALVKEVEEKSKEALAKRLQASAEQPQAENWDIENIAPAESKPVTIKPDLPTELQFDPNQSVTSAPSDASAALADRFKLAEAQLHAGHSAPSGASPLAAERQRRAQRQLLGSAAAMNLASSDNFSVATLSKLANRDESRVPI